jgi:hypothetical protein
MEGKVLAVTRRKSDVTQTAEERREMTCGGVILSRYLEQGSFCRMVILLLSGKGV